MITRHFSNMEKVMRVIEDTLIRNSSIENTSSLNVVEVLITAAIDESIHCIDNPIYVDKTSVGGIYQQQHHQQQQQQHSWEL